MSSRWRDSFECELEAEHTYKPTNPFAVAAQKTRFDRCMLTKGWTQVE